MKAKMETGVCRCQIQVFSRALIPFSPESDFQLKMFHCLIIITFFVNRFKSMLENVSNLIQILVFSRAHIPFSPESDFQLKILTGRHELSIIFHILIEITFIVHCVKSFFGKCIKFIQISF